MDKYTDLPLFRLCIFCRCLEPADQPCPLLPSLSQGPPTSSARVKPLRIVTPLSACDENLLESLRTQPSKLCRRCSASNIIHAFKDAPLPLDSDEPWLHVGEKWEMSLGKLSGLLLTPSCQFCRLIYRILPRELLHPDDDTITVVPLRSYLREPGWEEIPDEVRSETAVFLGIQTLDQVGATVQGISPDRSVRLGRMTGEAIALEVPFPGRQVHNARLVDPFVDFSWVRHALRRCQETHGNACHGDFPKELLTSRMLDVEEREIVPCPDNCDYVALSYRWGLHVNPPLSAIKMALPQTIEDAITVTKQLGKRYLWVDAYCIDQSPNPTPEQVAEKQQQLNMMNLIYSGASVTLVGLTGTSSNYGLPGVSPKLPRLKQVTEMIDGFTLFTMPPSIDNETDVSIWNTRAWTLQESYLARRSLFFSDNQVRFLCAASTVTESTDFASPLNTRIHSMYTMTRLGFFAAEPGIKNPGLTPTESADDGNLKMLGYNGFIHDYTSREMTNDTDSLNAALGVLAQLKLQVFPEGFVWGLPLKSNPESLGWFHARDSAPPKRRPLFPSWSWAGWRGAVLTPDMLLRRGDLNQPGEVDLRKDLTVQVVDNNSHDLVVEAWVVDLEVVTEPFSEARVPGSDEAIGFVTERNFLHNNTLPTGTYSCLVVQRAAFKRVVGGPEKQVVHMVVLEWTGQVAQRRTMLILTTFFREDFMRLAPVRKRVTLR
ncbi:heterokaryon incompatibility protein-domain-containing protein [Lasiosphaeris hirsuta]|uniref:Heterokaryon incompatibility protein-domain-containing protein n=1 Tax=Lasiosphaeris hirsuta TaxID=260670 RepID=A0AA40APX2_9PEZI|nr:heterokaryon incompatibility protein-domain-containing protein [Lasiosphaeris hirsuta]